ncbi:hypothetical protein Pcinc_009271 [Petrolisthes cinctipes]|uniref:Uncharacterized protein n=1 Tax=Petrolisthes cinctipes TaxID=88211 RepID=A0AAE1G7D1_PETCI|nr:hypothetical protein Pcinc_009271 [Petrolisthes cinctipes]
MHYMLPGAWRETVDSTRVTTSECVPTLHLPNSNREPAGTVARQERLFSRRRKLLVPVLQEGLLNEGNDNTPEVVQDAITHAQEDTRGDAREAQEGLLNERNDNTPEVVLDATVQPAQEDTRDEHHIFSTAVC